MNEPHFSLSHEQVDAMAAGLDQTMLATGYILAQAGVDGAARNDAMRVAWFRCVTTLHDSLLEQGCPADEAPGWVDMVIAAVKRRHARPPPVVPVHVGSGEIALIEEQA